MTSKTALEYRRLSNTRKGLRGTDLPDLPETAAPRYGEGVLLSHRRGQKRLSKWVKFKEG
jgi:hypothetical protein